MTPELVKVGCLRIEVLGYTNAREQIWKVKTYLKGEDFWASIKTVIKVQNTNKTAEFTLNEIIKITAAAVTAATSEAATLLPKSPIQKPRRVS